MEIIGIISGKGGIGKSTIAKNLSIKISEENKVLLIDSDFGFRTLDLMLKEENAIYDIYDFSKNLDDFESINNVEDYENLDFICASQSKTIEDCNMEILKTKLEKFSGTYKYIIVDIPRDEKTIVKWSQIVNRFLIITDDSDVSLRLTDKIMFIFLKNKIIKELNIIFNKIRKPEDFNLEEKYEIFMGPNIKIISYIPFLLNLEIEDYDKFMDYMGDILLYIDTGNINIRESEKNNNEEKGFLKKIFGK